MKKYLFLFLFLIFSSWVSSQSLRTYFNYCNFQSPKDGSYVECYLSVDGQTANWKALPEHKMQASTLITLIFYKDTSIVAFSKELLQSPILEDSASNKINFMQVKRIALSAGVYNLVISVDDVNDTVKELKSVIPIEFSSNDSIIEISGIQGIESLKPSKSVSVLTKGNFDMVPNVFNFYPEIVKQIRFYVEVYRSSKIIGINEPLIMSYYLKNHETDQKLASYSKYERKQSSEVIPCLFSFDISQLPSGNFDVVVEVRDKNNSLLASQLNYFQRDNPSVKMIVDDILAVNIESTFVDKITSIDSLCEIIRSLAPISSGKEKMFAESLIAKPDLRHLQQYLLYFFTERYPLNQETAFIHYMQEVAKVQKAYGNQMHKGYASDRGRVYLQYGPPNSISKSENETHALPYEIWHYYTIKNQSNRKFVFYNPNLAYNEFYIIHSDALGEINNSRWRLYVLGAGNTSRNVDATGEEIDMWGSQYNDFYNNPR